MRGSSWVNVIVIIRRLLLTDSLWKGSYTIQAHPTWYADVEFRSRLEATWAAFFDLCGWAWEYEPLDLEGWTPDFMITLLSLISKNRIVLAEVKPYYTIAEFAGHTCMNYQPSSDIALLGNNPDVTFIAASGRVIGYWVRGNPERLWKQALNATRYDPKGKRPQSYRLRARFSLVRMLSRLKTKP